MEVESGPCDSFERHAWREMDILPRAATDHVGPDRTCQRRLGGICTLKAGGDSFGREGAEGEHKKN
jgi:hypothetical protein